MVKPDVRPGLSGPHRNSMGSIHFWVPTKFGLHAKISLPRSKRDFLRSLLFLLHYDRRSRPGPLPEKSIPFFPLYFGSFLRFLRLLPNLHIRSGDWTASFLPHNLRLYFAVEFAAAGSFRRI